MSDSLNLDELLEFAVELAKNAGNVCILPAFNLSNDAKGTYSHCIRIAPPALVPGVVFAAPRLI
jgi:hypothetical protein